MAKTTITRALLLGLPPLPDGAAKQRVFDGPLPGFIAERRQSVTTFYLRYADARGRAREVKLGRLGDVTVESVAADAAGLSGRSAVVLRTGPDDVGRVVGAARSGDVDLVAVPLDSQRATTIVAP